MPKTTTPPPLTTLALTALFLGLGACSVPVAAALDEGDANRILVALDKSRVDATKEADPTAEGKFRVTVTRDDTARALTVLRDEELPRPRPSGVLDAVGKGALVPSQAAEHAQYVAGLAGDLERTLQSVDGVLSARVHLNVQAPDPLHDAPPAKTTASVLLEHRGASPPLASEAVQRLVAGGISGLAPADVAVVLVSRAAPAPTSESSLGHVGPIAVARGSMRALQASLIGLMALVAGLAAATLALYVRMARLRADVRGGDARGKA